MIKEILARKVLLIGIAIALVVLFFGYNLLFKKSDNGYLTEKIAKGTVIKDVSETGTIRASDNIPMSFKTMGKIKEIYVKSGDIVKTGQELAKMDSVDLVIQLNQARADLLVAQAKKSDASVSLNSAEQSLKDAELEAEDDLNAVYDDALTVLTDTYTKIYAAYNAVYEVQQSYFRENQGFGADVITNAEVIRIARDNIKIYINEITAVSGDTRKAKIDDNISKTEKQVSLSLTSINLILDIVRSAGFRDEISSTDKASLETHRTNINTAYSNVVSAIQTIETTKINNETAVNNAKADVLSLQNQLKQGSDSLYSAQVFQAQEKVSLLENQIRDTVIRSPIDGRVIESEKKPGEIVQAKETVLSVLSNNSYEIKANIYEGDIGDVRVGNSVKFELVAFPDQKFEGKVISIDPSEKLISDVVYYTTTVSIDKEIEGVKQGMTADITIEVAKKENVLMAPKRSIEKINGDRIISVLRNGKVGKIKIAVGLEGNEYTEIISGVSEGDEAVIGNKI